MTCKQPAGSKGPGRDTQWPEERAKKGGKSTKEVEGNCARKRKNERKDPADRKREVKRKERGKPGAKVYYLLQGEGQRKLLNATYLRPVGHQFRERGKKK